MILPENYKSRMRVHMGIPVLGVQNSGFALGYRFTNIIGLFEYRCNNLQPYEVAELIGLPTASNILGGTAVRVGDQIAIIVTPTGGAPISSTYTVTPEDLTGLNPYGQVDPFYTVATNAAALVTKNTGALVIGTSQPTVTWPQTTPGVGPPQWQMAYSAQNPSVTFTISLATTGALYAYPLTQGVQPNPVITFAEDQVTASGYIAICNYLEQRVALTSDIIKFTKADVVNIRQDEMEARAALYDYWRQRLADVMGVPLYPVEAASNFGGRNTGMGV